MMNSIEEKICQAIDIIVSKAISEASYDKTIQATIISCVDEVSGKYKVKYQDSTFYAFSTNGEITYSANTTVYVLVPGNDMSADKTILGAVKNLGTSMLATGVPDEDKYEKLGGSVFSSNKTYGLSSYRKGIDGTYTLLLYHKDYQPVQNYIDIDKQALMEYMQNAESIIFGGTVRTELPIEQQTRGNYGMILALNFNDNSTGNIVTRTYVVDVDKMTGNPYKYVYGTRQMGIFDIDAKNFVDIEYVALFTSNFPNTKPDDQCEDDIFINDMEFYCAKRLPDEALNGYYLSIQTPSGTYFDGSSAESAKRELNAEVMVKGKVLPSTTSGLSFYWFVEDASITAESIFYSTTGGPGWRCLNEYNILQKNDDGSIKNIEWIPATYQWIVKKSDILANQITYKCAAIYESNLFQNTVIITNAGSNYNLSIESDLGQQFYFDNGYPTLTCLVNKEEKKDYTYYWAVKNNTGNFQSLLETPDLNIRYDDLITQREEIENKLASGVLRPNAAQSQLDAVDKLLEEYDNTLRVDKNKVYKINVSEITNFSTYQCTVYNQDLFIGTVSIVLTNSLEAEGTYSLVINDGAFVYKYDEDGVAPTNAAASHMTVTKPLTFTIYNNLGQPIPDDIAKYADIQWIVPDEDTLLIIPEIYEYDRDIFNHIKIYNGYMSLTYDIASRYDVSCINNNIKLFVNYQGVSLSAVTSLTFVKDGEDGTNGTDFVCRIVPNTNDVITDYPTIVNGVWNFKPQSAGLYLKVQLWHNESNIFESTQSGSSQEGKQVTVTWSILKNKYGYGEEDTSSFTINQDSGLITYTGFNKQAPANIIKAQVSYDGVTYFATLPIITINNYDTSLYDVSLKYGSGFRYATYTSDGRHPSYSNANPFEINLLKLIDGFLEDIGRDQNVTYVWEYQGTLINDSKDVNLEDAYSAVAAEKNQKWVKPADDYDGHCVNNGILVTVQETGLTIAEIHIPVHLMLNRYGLSYLNDWDGNSVQVDSEGGFILAPQIGAGQKERDNSFTGVVMGKVKESGQSSASVGLFGYGRGVRTYFLDSYTGKTEIGARGKGQIILDPTNDKAIIRSGNYYYNSTGARGTGLEINFTEPYIKFGSSNFEVSREGFLTARGGGTIAGWEISDQYLSKNTVGISSDGTYGDNIAFWAGESEGSKEYAPFRVNYKGELVSTAGEIAGWEINEDLLFKGKVGISSDDSSDSNIAFWAGAYDSNGRAPSPTDSDPPFYVTYDGHLVSTDAKIAGWIINQTLIFKDTVGLNSDGSPDSNIAFWAGGSPNGSSDATKTVPTATDTSPKFYVTYEGNLVSTLGQIAGWIINENLIYKNEVGLNSKKSSDETIAFWAGDDSSGEKTDAPTATDTSPKFYVTYEGKLVSTLGKIAGWDISETEITSRAVGLSSDNSNEENIAFWAGSLSDEKNKAPFQVNYKGEITAIAGTIGGWNITNMMLYKDADGSGVGMFSAWEKSTSLQKKASAFWAGADQDKRNMAPFMVNFEGELTSKKGLIANWTITQNALYSKSVGMNSDTSKLIAFWAGKEPTVEEGETTAGNKVTPPGSDDKEENYAPFFVKFDGTLFSMKGTIGGWTITDMMLYKDAEDSGVGMFSAWNKSNTLQKKASAFWAGATNNNRNTAPFRVDFYGNMVATSGKIGDWSLRKGLLYSKSAGMSGNDSVSSALAFWAGASTTEQGDTGATPPTEAPFMVDFEGNMTSTAGKIGGWQITEEGLQNKDQTIQLLGDGTLKGKGWEIGIDGTFKGNGWEINNGNGTAHFSNIQIDSGQINGIDIKHGDDNQTYFVGVIENSIMKGDINAQAATLHNFAIDNCRIELAQTTFGGKHLDEYIKSIITSDYINDTLTKLASTVTIAESGKNIYNYVNDLIRSYLQMHITSTSKDVVYKSSSVESATRRVVTSVDFGSGTYGTDTIQVISSITSSNGGTIKYSYYDGE